MTISILLILAGFFFLIKGADWMVNGASTFAKKKNISELVIGLTVVAFGTSLPEMIINMLASLDNHQDIVFGNIIGSNNFNLFFILGIVGLVFPITVKSTIVWKEIPISFFATIILLLFCNEFFIYENKVLSRPEGFLLLFMFFSFLYYIYRQSKEEVPLESVTPKTTTSNLKIWIYIIAGLAGMIIGGKLVVDNAMLIATKLGLSEKIISLTIIAAGTSLPELTTSLVAAFKKKSDLAIGNVIGSNIFNILLILSTSAIINPMKYQTYFNTDIYLMLGGTLFLFIAMFTGIKKKLDRWEAGVLLGAYVVYTIYLITQEI